jgi:hypothetical protein
MKKAKHHEYGEAKSEVINVRVTPTAKKGVEAMARALGVSTAEFIERLGRGSVIAP